MMTLVFFSGIGVGVLATCGAFIIIVFRATHGLRKKTIDWNEQTLQAMLDRNKTDEEIRQILQKILDAYTQNP